MDTDPRPDLPTVAAIIFICAVACGVVTGALWLLDLVVR